MKKTLYLFAITGLLLGACDKIDEPYLTESGSSGPGPEPTEKVRKILLEEFTGHACVNCPEASIFAQEQLKAIYGEQLVLLSIHAGTLSIPADPPFEADYRTETGTAIFNYYDPAGVPMALINRTEYQNQYTMTMGKWQEAIQELIDLPPEAYIEMEMEYDDSGRKLDVHVHTEFLADLDHACNLSVFILESGIVSAQKNDDESIGPDIIEDYVHKHVLRTSLNGTWGDLLSTSPESGTTMTKDYDIILDNSWNADAISVVAVVINADTYEVIQAEEAHME